MQAMARQVEDQSHEESEPWCTSKPFAKLGKGLAKLSVVKWRKTEHFAGQNHQFGKVCQNFVRGAKIWQGVRKSLCVHRPSGKISRIVIFFLFTPFVIDKRH